MSGFDDQLRAALGAAEEADFDYDALVAGTKTRARRIRRRRALAQGATAAVLVPTLVGAGWMIGTNLSGSSDLGPDLAGTTQTSELPDPMVSTSKVQETVPPYQQVAPPAPLDPGGPESEAALSNRVQIPDARPTGIPFLDAFGAPQHLFVGPRMVPLDHFTGSVEDLPFNDAVEAHSGASWFYYDGSNEIRQTTVTITITAWDDSVAQLHALRTDEPTDRPLVWLAWEPRPDDPADVMPVRTVPDARPWAGHEGDENYLLALHPESVQEMHLAGALIRQGDYLVGVAVQDFSEGDALAAAAQIAEQTAANLAFLDPERGQD